AQRERQRGGDGEAGRAAQEAEAEADVLDQRVHGVGLDAAGGRTVDPCQVSTRYVPGTVGPSFRDPKRQQLFVGQVRPANRAVRRGAFGGRTSERQVDGVRRQEFDPLFLAVTPIG